jgi:cytoskeletal protein RodZ
MGRRILIILLLLILAAFAYVGYTSYDAKRAEATGEVFSRDSSNSPATKIEPETRTTDTPELRPPPQQTVVSPTTAPVPDTAAQTISTPALPTAPEAANTSAVAARDANAADTISPNPPNGMVFSGTGHYQLYRQGNLTWRVNTDTGQTCILFATDAEWKKSRVYRNGCKNR